MNYIAVNHKTVCFKKGKSISLNKVKIKSFGKILIAMMMWHKRQFLYG